MIFEDLSSFLKANSLNLTALDTQGKKFFINQIQELLEKEMFPPKKQSVTLKTRDGIIAKVEIIAPTWEDAVKKISSFYGDSSAMYLRE